MGEREDAEREFERVFGKAEKNPEHEASPSSLHAATQKLPSDSDLLGIRTDSDRFIFKKPIPERLPIEAPPAPKASTDSLSSEKGNGTSAPDAMTIALNVNVFANIPKPGEERKPGDLTNVTWSEATRLFVRKPPADTSSASGDGSATHTNDGTKQSPDFFNFSSQQEPKQSEEFKRAFGASGTATPAEPKPTATFTRIFHVQDAVALPQFAAPAQPELPIALPTPRLEQGINTTPVTPQAAGQSDFTRIVKGSELRALQEKFTAANASPPTNQNLWPTPATGTPSLPTGMATQIWSASSAPTLRSTGPTVQPWTPPNTAFPPVPKPPEVPTAEPSKLSQYMPLILVLNLLFLLAVLLIVFLAVKK